MKRLLLVLVGGLAVISAVSSSQAAEKETEPDEVPTLIRAITDPDREVADEAARQLTQLRSSDAISASPYYPG